MDGSPTAGLKACPTDVVVTFRTLERMVCERTNGFRFPRSPVIRRGRLPVRLFPSGNHALAEDIAAETFARALTAGDRIQTGTVKAYLLRIARNLFVDAVRRDTRLENLTGSEEQISDPSNT